MSNREIIRLLKDLRWDEFTAPDGASKTCRGCGVSYMPCYGEKPPKHKNNCRVARAIRSLQPHRSRGATTGKK